MNYTKEEKMQCNLNELKVNEDKINGVLIVKFESAKKISDTNRHAAKVTLEDGKSYTSAQLVKLGVKVEGEKKPRTEGAKKGDIYSNSVFNFLGHHRAAFCKGCTVLPPAM